MTQLPVIIDKIAQLHDEELCLMMEDELAWIFNLPPHEDPHSAPFVGDELYTLYYEIVRRLRRYSKKI